MPTADTDFSKFNQTKIVLYLHDPVIRKHTAIALQHLGFEDVTDYDVPRNYFEALKRLISIIPGESDLVLMNLPDRPAPPGAKKADVDPIFETINSTFLDIKTNLAKRTSDPLKLLSKTVPVIEVGDYLRDKLIEVLFKFRVPAAFFMSAIPDVRHLKGARKTTQSRENLQVHLDEITKYLSQYFRDKDELVALADEKLTEKELSERKKKFDQLMAEAEKCKQSGEYERAITLLKQAIETYPKDIEPYLESGRLYVRRREYGRALARFSQAEELFEEAPSPNKEIANVRIIQAKEKIAAGADPNSPEIMELLNDATENFRQAHAKTVEMTEKAPESPDLNQPLTIGQEIYKWGLADFLGPKHPAVQELNQVARETTAGLDSVPLEELSTMQCLALGLQAVDEGNIPQAERYYFQALKDRERFGEVCTEINLFGMRLRSLKNFDEAIRIYDRLLEHKPHNQGAVYWNMAIAYAYKNDRMSVAGYISRSLYTDPYLPRENEFYITLTPNVVPVLINMLKVLRLIHNQSKSVKAPPQLMKLYHARLNLGRLIRARKQKEALALFFNLFKKAQKFTVKIDFYCDGEVPRFLQEIKASLAKSKDPKQLAMVKTINSYLKYVAGHPAPPQMAKFMTLIYRAIDVLEEKGDQHQAAFFLGQALLLMPATYYQRPDFFAFESIPALVVELSGKFKYIDTKRIPKPKPTKASGKAASPAKRKAASPA